MRDLLVPHHPPDEAMGLAREFPPGLMRIVREGSEKRDEVALAA